MEALAKFLKGVADLIKFQTVLCEFAIKAIGGKIDKANFIAMTTITYFEHQTNVPISQIHINSGIKLSIKQK